MARLPKGLSLLLAGGCAHLSAHDLRALQPSYGAEVEAAIARFDAAVPNDKGKPVGLGAAMAELHVPGVSVAVAERGKVVWARAFGLADAAHDTPVTPATRFQAASISKTLTAVAALRLVEQGKLSLDGDVNAQLHSFQLTGKDGVPRAVSLRQLLSHTAGTTVHGFGGYAEGEALPTLRQVLDGQRPANSWPVRVQWLPGAGSRYSGGGFEVVEALIVEATGKPFADALAELVFQPAGLSESSFAQGPSGAQVSSGHDGEGKPIPGRFHRYPETAAAGLWTTPADLLRLCLALRLDGPAPLLTETMLAQLVSDPSGDRYGLGVGLPIWRGVPMVGHNGANAGFGAIYQCDVGSGTGVAAMTNRDYSALVDRLRDAALTTQGFRGLDRPVRVDRLPELASEWKPIPGAHAPRWSRLGLAPAQDGKSLRLLVPRQVPIALKPVDEGLFELQGFDDTSLVVNPYGLPHELALVASDRVDPFVAVPAAEPPVLAGSVPGL